MDAPGEIRQQSVSLEHAPRWGLVHFQNILGTLTRSGLFVNTTRQISTSRILRKVHPWRSSTLKTDHPFPQAKAGHDVGWPTHDVGCHPCHTQHIHQRGQAAVIIYNFLPPRGVQHDCRHLYRASQPASQRTPGGSFEGDGDGRGPPPDNRGFSPITITTEHQPCPQLTTERSPNDRSSTSQPWHSTLSPMAIHTLLDSRSSADAKFEFEISA